MQRLERSRAERAGASLTVIVEGESTASYRENAKLHALRGLPPPEPRVGCEVVLWDDASQASKVYRGATTYDALRLALKHRQTWGGGGMR